MNVGEEKIYGVALPFPGGEVHAARAGDEVVDVGRRFFQNFEVGVFALLADEFVGVGFARKRENADLEILFEEKRDGALGCGLAGVVGVVVDDDAAREAGEEFDLRLGKAGAAAGHYVADPGASDRDRVHVAFDENGKIGTAQRLFGAVEVVEDVALRIDRCFRRVEVFRLVVAERAATESNDFSGFVGDGERDTAAEAIEEAAAALIARDQAGFYEKLVGVFCFEDAEECVAAAGCVADAELFDHVFGDAAIFEIRARDFAFGSIFEVLGEKCLGGTMYFDQQCALLILAALFG